MKQYCEGNLLFFIATLFFFAFFLIFLWFLVPLWAVQCGASLGSRTFALGNWLTCCQVLFSFGSWWPLWHCLLDLKWGLEPFVCTCNWISDTQMLGARTLQTTYLTIQYVSPGLPQCTIWTSPGPHTLVVSNMPHQTIAYSARLVALSLSIGCTCTEQDSLHFRLMQKACLNLN